MATSKRIVRRPAKRPLAVPEVFSALTARDWRHIRDTERSLERQYDGHGENPEEIIMTSKGYLDVGHDSEGGFVRAHGFYLLKDFWPRPRKTARKVRPKASAARRKR